jgi:hypothetical protein
MLVLYEKGIEILKNKISNKEEIFWENYNLVIWKKNESGYFKTDGCYRNNSWGIKKIIYVNSNQTWSLPVRYVKYFQ